MFGSIGEVGPAWRSMRGGTIDRRINLAINTGGRFEGGPVLDAKGGLIGMTSFWLSRIGASFGFAGVSPCAALPPLAG